MTINSLYKEDIKKLKGMVQDAPLRSSRDQLINTYIQQVSNREKISMSGVLELKPNAKFAFIRYLECDLHHTMNDVYVGHSMIQKYYLRNGDIIKGLVSFNDKYFILSQLVMINDIAPEDIGECEDFESLTPVHPSEQMRLESVSSGTELMCHRFVDWLSPIGFGQRVLISAPPKSGKSHFIKSIANTLSNREEITCVILLIDERVEETTELKSYLNKENVIIVSSTFDKSPQHHIHVAELVCDMVKRMAEANRNVVLFIDSITRLVRAYNFVNNTNSKVLSGGIDSHSLQKSKSILAIGRNLKEGGSITIFSTVLTDTNSKMDGVIFEELRGTSNSDICLSRKLSSMGCYPAIDILHTSTRRIDSFLSKEHVAVVNYIRQMAMLKSDNERWNFIKSELSKIKLN